MTQTLKPAVSPRSGFSDSNVPDQLLADPRACPRVRGWLSPYPRASLADSRVGSVRPHSWACLWGPQGLCVHRIWTLVGSVCDGGMGAMGRAALGGAGPAAQAP